MDILEYVWEQTWQWMTDDIVFNLRRQGIQLYVKETKHLCLSEIKNLLQGNRKSLRDFPSMPYPIGYAANTHGNKLIYNEMAYDKELLHAEFNKYYHSLTYYAVVATQLGGVYFLYGYGGTRKTFIWKTLSSTIRSNGGIVLTVASRRTTHSKFAIPVPATQNSTCNMHQGSDLAELLKITKLIIWDEAPMCHKFIFQALDKSLKDIMHNDRPFGGKVIVFCGDFSQILPVVPRGNRFDIIHASLNASYIWDHCQILKLTKKLHLQTNVVDSSNHDLKQFFDWLLDIGDGKLREPNDGYVEISIPNEFLIKHFNDPTQTTYPNLLQNYSNGDFLHKRVVLASTKDVVDSINDYVMSLIPIEEKENCSVDSVDKSDELLNPAFGVLTPEFLNSLKTSRIPNHKLKIKIGTPIILLRNLDQADGLCNGTRLIVTRLGAHVVEAEIITGSNIGHRTYIPRMNMSPSDSPWPFKLIRRQFSFMVSFAMTINKCRNLPFGGRATRDSRDACSTKGIRAESPPTFI
uniref:ATP-dependent DNA helicase n=1 Tax=Glycine max TaxID=3847 RepID=A0A0R0L7T8_SOYBN